MSFLEAQRKLTSLWFILGSILFVILLIQLLGGKYGNRYLEIVTWYSQMILPTLSIITTAVLYVNQHRADFLTKKVDVHYLKLVKGLTFFYFGIIFILIAMQPVAYKNLGLSAFELLQNSSLVLGIFQGLLNALLGIFFIKS